ncbi:MAG: cytochrome c biogenesis protein CcsA [Crocinitomicaceae bacterium]|nr:cytochrome c biogenesis protein CcsA [Crocinitomicaceae bacterium]
MEKFVRFIFSMRMMALGMIIFLLAIAVATFLESTYDTQTARILIYNALWFEILLGFLGFNLIANIFTYKMYKAEKIAMLMFHLSFIVIIIGAGVTRYVSFEGMMMVRENEESNIIYSSDPYFYFIIEDGDNQTKPYDTKVLMSEITPSSNYFEVHVPDFPGHNAAIHIEYADFRKNLIDSLVVNDTIQGSVLEIVTDGMSSNFVAEGEFLMLGDISLSFDKDNAMPGIQIVKEGAKYLMSTKMPMHYLPMSEMQKAARNGSVPDSLFIEIPIDSLVPFQTATLYKIGGQQFVFKQALNHAQRMKMPADRKGEGSDFLTLKITDGDLVKYVDLEGGAGSLPERAMFEFNGLNYHMDYGAKQMEIPFSIFCRDFQLDKYPGSNSPSSFASEVTVIDTVADKTFDRRIFMNEVLDYGGYRFFQSGYDPDEGGTHLSVNHDAAGTMLSYIGYLMMTIGMVMSLFASSGRFRELFKFLKKSREKRKNMLSAFIGAMILSSMAFGQNTGEEHHEGDGHNHSGQQELIHEVVSVEHSEELASFLIQDEIKSRIIPYHTLCDELLIKLSRKNTFGEYNAVQTVMSMHLYRSYWVNEDVIYVSSKSNLREELGTETGLVSFKSLTDSLTSEFILLEEYKKSHQKIESSRDEYDKRLIKLGERYHVFQQILLWGYMKFVPMENDPDNKWYDPFKYESLGGDSATLMLVASYMNELHTAAQSGKYGTASDLLTDLKAMQRNFGHEIVPSTSIVEMEISYNKMHVFKNTMRSYIAIGFGLLLVFFVRIFFAPKDLTEKIFKWITRILIGFTLVIFLYHGYGLAMRWIISGHAPWSNAYEAIVFIAWIAVAAGLGFSRRHAVILSAATILAFLLLFVSEMNFLDPEITSLQPVLKSYWLMIHVAIITGSYAPLGLSCIISFLNLILYVFRSKKRKEISYHINELTYVAEMSMTIGLFMLAVGTFLGGVWANESWGRYWGWDPKETWALVAVLVYAVILHFRYIPALKSKFTFNVFSFWGYTAIMFTLFGVNFYLVGLHSYAQGEGLAEIPQWLYWFIAGAYVFTEIAYIQYKRHELNGIIPAKVLLKKLIAIVISIVFIFGFTLIFKLFSFSELVSSGGKIIGLVVVVNALLFLYSYLRGKTAEDKSANSDL